jgi:hypothetical protein
LKNALSLYKSIGQSQITGIQRINPVATPERAAIPTVVKTIAT